MMDEDSVSASASAPQKTTASEVTVTICNVRGLHARASAKFVQCVEQYNSKVTVTRDNQSVGGTSIMGLMMLAAVSYTHLTLPTILLV